DAHRRTWQKVFSRPVLGGPITRGFDSYFGTDVPNWPPFCFIENDSTVGIPSEFLPARLFEENQASIQGPALKDWTLEPILPTLAKRAEQFIRQAAKTPEPFLLYMPLTSPHTPLAVNENWKGKSGLGMYGDFVMETDALVGQILAALDSSGQTQDTLVIFTSDNGCAPYIGVEELEAKGHYPSGPLRGYKSDAWEGGHRVPFIVRWPDRVEADSVCHQLIHQADILATLANIMDRKLPENQAVDSFSILPLLGGIDEPVRQNAVSCSSRGLPGFRLGNWKLIPGEGSGGWSKGGEGQPVQLYNLAEDIGERKNLASLYPERVQDMQIQFEQLIASGRSTAGEPQKNDVPVVRYNQ
ncbi:MAG: sulfatase-like hydrolase/transferase, partial [Verrucomicrobiae bacterium]|nr:sulfatase-like hydrolase/transferase [Verrucomicrobiae bacterium]